MKIAITGSTGFIGSNLVKFYNQHEIIPLKREDNIADILFSSSPDLIINCAAEIYNHNFMYASNVELTKSLLDYIRVSNLTSMVQVGSSSEYGQVNGASNELCPITPTNLYAATKGMATLMCQAYAHEYNLDVVIVRPYSVYGPGEKSHRLFPKLCRSFLINEPMTLAQGVHDFCYVDDFISGINHVINSSSRTAGEIINISNGVESTNLQVLSIFQNLTNRNGNVTIDEKFVTYPRWLCDNTKICQKYKWTPTYNLETGIKKMLDLYKD